LGLLGYVRRGCDWLELLGYQKQKLICAKIQLKNMLPISAGFYFGHGNATKSEIIWLFTADRKV